MDDSSIPEQIGDFRVFKELGRGKIGIVYLAEDSRIDRQVAIKVMRKEMVDDIVAKQRFFLEARSLASIQSDHVVTLHMVAEEMGVPFLVMEYLEGESLQSFLDSRKKWSISRILGFAKEWSISTILRIAKEIAIGLTDVHEAGLIHRDIKPEHLFLQSPGDRVKIIDFGTVKLLEPSAKLYRPTSILGTLGYMPLDHARGVSIDHRVDIFSAGVVFYQLCTGHLPFQGTTIQKMVHALTDTTPPSVSSRNPKIPQAFSDLIDQMIASDPENRPPSMNDVLTKLDAISV
jgi:serine/threonine protein kinase